MNTNGRVIVALDFENAAQAATLVEQLGTAATFYKVGLQLLTAEGPSVVRELVAAGKQVFLDLKLLEIANSVAGAVAALANSAFPWSRFMPRVARPSFVPRSMQRVRIRNSRFSRSLLSPSCETRISGRSA